MVLNDARSLLEQLTPLKRDCGTLCGGACCRSLEGEATGMLLFPGEEDDYVGLEGWQLTETKQGWLVSCPGTCDRSIRPLACRIFPCCRYSVRMVCMWRWMPELGRFALFPGRA